MYVFDKIRNKITVNAVKQIHRSGELEESLSDNVQTWTIQKYVLMCLTVNGREQDW